MNVLYEAIMLLGRSITNLDRFGWTKGALVNTETGAKCANGLLTACLDEFDPWPRYLSDEHFAPTRPYEGSCPAAQVEALRIASMALVKAVPPDVWAKAVANAEDFQRGSLQLARQGNPNFMHLEVAIVRVNDRGGLDQAGARQWFSDAIDVLAEGLPVPAQPVVRTAETNVRTLTLV